MSSAGQKPCAIDPNQAQPRRELQAGLGCPLLQGSPIMLVRYYRAAALSLRDGPFCYARPRASAILATAKVMQSSQMMAS